MNILVITGSPRKNGNTEIMAGVFAASAIEAGLQVTVRKLSESICLNANLPSFDLPDLLKLLLPLLPRL